MALQDGRDWLKTLWAASFKGQAFYFDADEEEGGQDNVKHVFPHRDDPFVEPMGEALRYFSGTAYVFGDHVDALDAAMKRVMSSGGAGMLVTPLTGPVMAHAETFKRRHEKDKLGYVAFEVKFVRAGASSGLISVPLALNVAFLAVDSVAAAIAGNFAAGVIADPAQPDFVADAAANTLLASVAALDVVRQSFPVDPAQSGALRDTLSALIAQIPDALASGSAADLAASLIQATRDLADAMPAESAARAMLEIANASLPLPSAPLTPLETVALTNIAAAYRVARLAALTAWAEAILRTVFVDRPSGVTVRAEVAARFEVELYDTHGAVDSDLVLAIEDLRGRVIDYLSQQITNLAPLIEVTTVRSLPALFMAWRLYADPKRAGELVARNRVRHPAFMPKSFLALSR